jgi:hypothetical protein
MGAVIRRFFQVAQWLAVLLLIAAALPAAAAQRQPKKSPHGNLNIPCENCHTATSWAPIRAVPEFNHDSTRFALRGMHEKVSCTGCHVKPVFTDVGKDCANCHADIHRGQFGANCAQCHTVNGWQVNVQQISQHFNRFPLLGMHAVVECDECHKNAAAGVYTGLTTACQTCHMTEFNATTNPAHAANQTAFPPSQCQVCHSNFDNWANANFNHATTGFILDGAHATTACAACHVNNNYNLSGIAQTDCGNSQCHLTTWQQTNNPAHASAPTAFPLATCSTCHNDASWLTSTFNHSSTGFLLTNGHANLQCTQCHINNNYTLTIAPTDCGNSQCHLTTWQQTNNPVHPSAGAAFATSLCSTCHNTVGWTTATFDHSTTGFLLTQGHANLQCTQCHINNNYALTIAPTACGNSQCHLTDWTNTNQPVHSTSGAAFGAANCANCHTPAGWTAASFDHSITGFTLVGTHMSPNPTPCASCHISNNYTLSSGDCMTCHTADYQRTTTIGGNVPNHVTANFPSTASACAACHPITTWAAGTFDHSSFGFPLTQGHANLQCTQCHINGNYSLQIAATDCGNSQCHLTDWTNTNNPVHSSAGAAFAASLCSTCHTTAGWTSATFNHNSTTFPLTGLHVSVACTTCHVGNNYAGTLPTNCGGSGCHLTDWQNTNAPPHQTVSTAFPAFAATNCANCHTTSVAAFATATWDHGTTGFALTGFHTTMACALCHVGNNYALPATTCYTCHTADYNSTANLGGAIPNHPGSGFPTDCTICHTTTNWTSSIFNHNSTSFPLTGLHVSATCASCHVGNNYSGTLPTTCDGSTCHLTTWQTTNAPPHQTVATAFPAFASANCANCHTTSVAAFATATWDHGATGFALTGFHTTMACALCHIGNNYALTSASATCWNCHQPDYNSTANIGGSVPNHVTAAFPQDCTICHTTTNWTGATFNHNTTAFPLTGFHTGVACASCHTAANGGYGPNVPTLCSGCHMADYNSTVSLSATNSSVPNHVALSYPTTCDSCHTTTSWLGATFNHASTGFALNGMHATIACNLCHTSNAVPPVDCYSCHSADWSSTQTLGGQIPNHVAAALLSTSGFATTTTACVTCHTANAVSWTSATFTHSWFPTSHGNAGGVCATCHTNANDYTVFQCTGCHGNNNSANFHHPNVGGYVYASPNCYACHPRGNGG